MRDPLDKMFFPYGRGSILTIFWGDEDPLPADLGDLGPQALDP